MLKEPEIAAAVLKQEEKLAAKLDITIETITAMLLQDRTEAISLGQISASVSASMGLAKLHGLVVDKRVTGTVTLNDSKDKVRDLLAKLSGAG